MGKYRRKLLQGFLLLLVSFEAWAELPDRINTAVPDDPYFVSAETALKLTPEDPFYERIKGTLKYLVGMPETEGCAKVDWLNTGYQPNNGPIELTRLAQRAQYIVLTVVESARGGFQGNEPGQLLRLRFEGALKGSPEQKEAFLFVPVGEMKLAERRYCIHSYGVPSPPAVGERLLIFFNDRVFQPESSTLKISVMHWVILPTSGPVRFSSALNISSLNPNLSPSTQSSSIDFLDSLRKSLARQLYMP